MRAAPHARVSLALGVLALAAAPSVRAEWPPPEGADLTLRANQPDDPGYPGQWNLFSYIPPESFGAITAAERAIGSGVHADRAWQRTIGDRRVVIAVLDSGAAWSERELVNQYYLNRGELPVPDAACGVAAGGDPYDVNGDGFFNVQDYTTAVGHDQPAVDRLCDPSVSDQNGNGLVDPQDLILLFSDGVDGDGNGWIDDVSGWDAFHDDNDAHDDTDFGHGRGEARDSAGETDNGMGDAGVCPECMILMVRCGDSFVVDGKEFATGVFFAVDAGAAVIQEALGAIDHPAAATAAIDYAVAQGAAVVASAADEDSFHHNMPGTANHTIYVHANTYAGDSVEEASTFLAFNNCTNYGAQLLLSTPGTACSSEATGKTSGIVGLLYAAALAVDLPPLDAGGYPTDLHGARRLHGEEVKQLLLTTVDDIHDPTTAGDPDFYPTRVGWEQRFGYGRTNARGAVDAVFARRIPPIVDVTSPRWFATLHPDRAPVVAIEGSIRYRAAIFDGFDYVVEWAPGIEPDDADFQTLAEGMGETEEIVGTLAEWDLSSVTVDNPAMPEPDVDVNRFMVTVRVRVVLHGPGEVEGTRGEVRRAFHVVRDPDLLAGYPVDVGASLESSPKISDLDGDGVMELVQADSSGLVHVFDAAGAERPGFPAATPLAREVDPDRPGNHRAAASFSAGALASDLRSAIVATPAVGDLDGSGPPGGKDIVVATLDGQVVAFSSGGQLLPGFPVAVDPEAGLHATSEDLVDVGIFSTPVLGDLDGDGDLEIVVAAYDGFLYVWHHDGGAAAGFPRLLSSGAQQRRVIGSPALGDLDGDGAPEIVVGTTELYSSTGRLYALRGDGALVDGWPVPVASIFILPLVGEGLPNSPAMADVDGDGDVEVAMAGIVPSPTIYDGDGRRLGDTAGASTEYGPGTTVSDSALVTMVSSGSFGDLDNDGVRDLVWGAGGFEVLEAFTASGRRVDFDHALGAWPIRGRASGAYPFHPGFPRRMDDWQFFMNPAIADVDGDGRPEILNGSSGYYLRAWNVEGAEPAGWPKMTGQWILASPAVGDLDGDGRLEVAVGTRSGFLYAWRTQGPTSGRVDWASARHDDRNTGNFEVALAFGSGPARPAAGCGCRAGGGAGGAGGAAVALIALLVVRRRRLRRA